MTSSTRREIDHRVTYPRFLLRALWLSTEGSWAFYIWLFVLTGIALVGVNAWAHQVALGMGTTGMATTCRGGCTSPTSPSPGGSPRGA